jgi:uncharacterized membrane protein YoaK (UPF0700 family)
MYIEPKATWVLAGGCCLAFLAAAVNVCFLMELGTSVSHLTGDLSHVAEDLARPGPPVGAALVTLAVALAGFVTGAALSGYFIHHRALELSRPYGRSITGIGLLLLAAWLVMPASHALATGLAAAGCGFQNALATHHRGVILRTTHVTGLLTDLGIAAGMRLRHRHVAAWTWIAPLSLVLAFFAGAAVGAGLTLGIGRTTVAVLGSAYVVGGLGWTLTKHRWLRPGGQEGTGALV